MANREHTGPPTFKDVNIEEIPPITQPSEKEDEPNNDNDESSTLPGAENVKTIDILMVGLDNAGKTKLLYNLMFGNVEDSVRTIGYNVETVEYNENRYTIWDVGGHQTIRDRRTFYMENKSFVIYVVDASDAARFEEAQQDLHDLMSNSDLSEVVLIVLANKMDLVPEFKTEDLVEHLKLENLKQKWKIHGCSAVKDGKKLCEISELLQTYEN